MAPNSLEMQHKLQSGTLLDEDLTVISRIGKSKKAEIYKCHSRRLDGYVSCKVLRSKYREQTSAVESFRREAGILLDMDHPNVVKGISFTFDSPPRIVMEYLRGQNVKRTFFTGNYDAFDVGEIISMLEQVANALSHVHSKSVLHLDVKPSNVMYNEGHATLFDFSVAKRFSVENKLRTGAGTRNYKAPEQMYREEAGFFTDVFGLGAMSYQLLTGGRLPYMTVEEANEHGETKSVLDYTRRPPHPSRLNPRIPRAAGAVILAAIDPNPSERFATVEEFREALMTAVQEGADTPRRRRHTTRRQRPLTRSKKRQRID